MSEPFWMIYGMGQSVPTMKHDTFEAARTEAERLARFNPNIEFFVLQSIACAKKVDVEFRRIHSMSGPVNDDELPF